MVAEKILGNIQDKPQKKAIIPVAFEWFELEKRELKRQRKMERNLAFPSRRC